MDSKLVLPADILRHQVCSQCYQYLSVIPVEVNGRGEKVCGRCVLNRSDYNSRTSKTTSKYNIMSQGILYKCVNHFEGCQALLGVHQTLQHEERCKNKKLNCFFCSFYGNLCQIVFHCAQVHAENVTWNGSFQLSLKASEVPEKIILVKDSSVLLIRVDISNKSLNIVISSIAMPNYMAKQYAIRFWLPAEPDVSKLEFIDYGLFNLDFESCFKKPLGELEYHFGTSSIIFWCQILFSQIEVTEKAIEVDKRYRKVRMCENTIREQENQLREQRSILEKEKLKLGLEMQSLIPMKNLLKTLSADFFTCMTCKKIATTNSAYFCTKQHCYCSDCLINNCVKCGTTSYFTEPKFFQKISVECDWPGCEESISVDQYIVHKRDCLMRPYKCPIKECDETVLTADKLKEHWHCKIPFLVTKPTKKYNVYNTYAFYWLVNKELYLVLVEFYNRKTEILIEEVNVLPNNTTFYFMGYCSGYKDWNTRLDFTKFCDKFKLSSDLSSRGYPYDEIKLYVNQFP